jgi:hypothetical protein
MLDTGVDMNLLYDAAQHARQFSLAQIQLWTTQSMFENSVRDT